MTREEAIAFFEDMNECTYGNLEAVEMAITALTEELSEDGTLTVHVSDGSKVKRVFVMGENIFGGLYYPDSAESKGDSISRQAVLDELEKWDWQDLYLPIHFKQILDDVPSVENKREWIPVSERLPEEDTDVIYCTADGETGYCHYYKGFNSTAYIFNNYPDTAERIMYKNVVAWLPIPEPYKENEA